MIDIKTAADEAVEALNFLIECHQNAGYTVNALDVIVSDPGVVSSIRVAIRHEA